MALFSFPTTGKDKASILQIVLNLENSAGPNWQLFKEWIKDECEAHGHYAATNFRLPDNEVRAMQGMAAILSDLAAYLDNPREALIVVQNRQKMGGPSKPVI